jgi:hypothetical protein
MNSLIIHEEMCNAITHSYSTDDDEAFSKNNKRLGEKWKYYNSKIEYKFNSLGYRTKELTDLNNNFLLTFGCSYTEGV